MYVSVKLLNSRAKLPKRQTEGSSGFDLEACIEEPIELPRNEHIKIPTGLAFAIPVGYEGQIRPRSGLSLKYGVLTAFGTIDSDYRGEFLVVLYNHGAPRFVIEPGMRIAQLVICPVVYPELIESYELPNTNRGSSGFGSTGL